MIIPNTPHRRLVIALSPDASPVRQRAVRIVTRQIESRCPARVGGADVEFTLRLVLDPQLPAESYRIGDREPGVVEISGSDDLGLLYGAGKFLRSSRYTEEGFVPGAWRGFSKPDKPLRGMYLATHFNNFYHDAPIEQVVAYIEDLALWGINTVQVWYDLHHYTGIGDPGARAMIGRLRAILAAAKAVGLRICLGSLGNEAYADSPEALRADFNTGRASYGVELCPSKPGAMDLLLQWHGEALDAFADLSPDFIAMGPYDQGGCACADCKPWGANGYLRIARAKAEMTKRRFPGIQVILSAWLFDHGRDQGEWQGLADAFAGGVDWCDYIQADSHEDYPEFPLKHGVPGKLPLLNFAEISMWMMHPWGGFGANPLPTRFQRLWNQVKERIAGGFPYSEGIYEDINKALCAQLYWSPERTVESILKEYIAFEFSPDVVDEVLPAIRTLEQNHNHLWTMNWELQRQCRFPIRYQTDPAAAYDQMARADARLTPAARRAWRWRILYLRALMDRELQPTEGYWGNEVCEDAFRELTEIYCAQGAELKCAPPTREAIRAMRSSEGSVTA
jgi:hypothetical protein